MTGEDLSFWLPEAIRRAKAGEVCLIVQGDDSLTVFRDGPYRDGPVIFLENDFKSFDQSQKGVPNEAELAGLLALGCPQAIVDLMFEQARLKATVRMRTNAISYTMRFKPANPRRVTGGPNTTLSNTYINVLMLLLAYFGDFTEERWTSIGVEAKMKRSQDVSDVMFLHGTWLPLVRPVNVSRPGNNWTCLACGKITEIRGIDCFHCHMRRDDCRVIYYAWTIRPSAALKRGKACTNSTKRPKMLEIAYGLGAGMGEVTEGFPILSAWRKKLIELGRVSPPIEEPFHIQSDFTEALDCEYIRTWMTRQYDLTYQQIDEMEEAIRSVTYLPSFVGHAGFTALAADYL
jgi:hypothetical protein